MLQVHFKTGCASVDLLRLVVPRNYHNLSEAIKTRFSDHGPLYAKAFPNSPFFNRSYLTFVGQLEFETASDRNRVALR